MNQSFWGLVWSNFQKIQGVLLGVIGIIIGRLLWLFSPKTTIPLWLFLLVAILASELFSIDAVVSFYFMDNNFKLLIAMGRVVNIQRDSKIQVELIQVRNGYEPIVNKLENNDSITLSKTRIKPNIPRAFLDGTL